MHHEVKYIMHVGSAVQRARALALEGGQGLHLAGEEEMNYLELNCSVRIDVYDPKGTLLRGSPSSHRILAGVVRKDEGTNAYA